MDYHSSAVALLALVLYFAIAIGMLVAVFVIGGGER